MLLTQDQIDLRNAWGDFADEVGRRRGGWDWFATGTFRELDDAAKARGWTKVGRAYSERAVEAFLGHVGDLKGLRDIHWFRGREYQRERGVPHYHMLIGNVGDVSMREAWGWWFERYGFARIERYEADKGARFYLCKYVTKPMGEFEFSDNLVVGGA